MMKGMDKDSMKSMAKMAQQMRPQMEAMKAAQGGGASNPGGGGDGGDGGMPGAPAGFDPSNMDLDKGIDMMQNMSPDMMKAGIDMMKNMDPKVMASLSKSMGREISEGEMAKMQGMMSDMNEEDLQKWAGRAQKVATVAEKPLKLYRGCRAQLAKAGAGGLLAGVIGLLAVLAVGHVTDTF